MVDVHSMQVSVYEVVDVDINIYSTVIIHVEHLLNVFGVDLLHMVYILYGLQ